MLDYKIRVLTWCDVLTPQLSGNRGGKCKLYPLFLFHFLPKDGIEKGLYFSAPLCRDLPRRSSAPLRRSFSVHHLPHRKSIGKYENDFQIQICRTTTKNKYTHHIRLQNRTIKAFQEIICTTYNDIQKIYTIFQNALLFHHIPPLFPNMP